ncbi:MAG: guanylate kinase [Dehalococcoidales bacterium]|nr:guanylate kinase [Dehalococcoidales bacterium]
MKNVSRENQPPFDPQAKPLLIVLSGPSGVGKDALLSRIRQSGYPLQYVTTVTTRCKRSNERDNEHYHFVSPGEFQEMIKKEELLEWANVYGNWYGVPRGPVQKALGNGQDTIVKVDIQGAATIKKILPGAVSIIIIPPSIEELVSRLDRRSTETPFDLALRVKTARGEVKQLSQFDYVVVNKEGAVDLAVSEIKAIITAEKCRVKKREIIL